MIWHLQIPTPPLPPNPHPSWKTSNSTLSKLFYISSCFCYDIERGHFAHWVYAESHSNTNNLFPTYFPEMNYPLELDSNQNTELGWAAQRSMSCNFHQTIYEHWTRAKKLMDKANLCSPTQELLMFQICSSKFKNTYSQVNYIKQNCIASLHQVILVTGLDSHLVLFICQHQSENKNLTTEYTLRNDLMMKYDNANCSSSNILLYCSV